MVHKSINPSFDTIELPIENLTAIQTTRLHPIENKSELVGFNQFNLGTHVGDVCSNVLENRQTLERFLPENSSIQWLNQIHGNEVTIVERVSQSPITADAAITRRKNVAIAVMTADCLPIILASKYGNEIAVIHGGWKPLAKGIISSTLTEMNSPADELIAWLGPCIGPTNFEVGSEVFKTFCSYDAALAEAFTHSNEFPQEKYYGSLHKLASKLLSNEGVLSQLSLPNCTVAMNQRYYSYRKEKTTGRMATLACLQ